MWQIRCAMRLIAHEYMWSLRMWVCALLLGHRLQGALKKLRTTGVAVIPRYYSEEELLVIDQCCSRALADAKDKPPDPSLIVRMPGSIRIKHLGLTDRLLRRFGLDIYILFINFVFQLRLIAPTLIYGVTHDGSFTSDAVPGKAEAVFGGNWHCDQWFHQLKAIIPLDDINLENGPLNYIPGSSGIYWEQFSYYLEKYMYNKGNPETRAMLQKRHEAMPYDISPLDSSFAERMVVKNGSYLATAKRGDLILFDTRNIHSALVPTSGYRRLLWMYF